jgi:hypothetical protein
LPQINKEAKEKISVEASSATDESSEIEILRRRLRQSTQREQESARREQEIAEENAKLTSQIKEFEQKQANDAIPLSEPCKLSTPHGRFAVSYTAVMHYLLTCYRPDRPRLSTFCLTALPYRRDHAIKDPVTR